MNGSHAAGATIGALIAYVASHYGWNVSTDEALTWGAAAGAVGGGIAHLFQPPGLVPRVKAGLGVTKKDAPQPEPPTAA